MRSVFKLRNIRTPQSCLALCDGFSSASALLRHELAYVLGQMQMDEVPPRSSRFFQMTMNTSWFDTKQQKLDIGIEKQFRFGEVLE